MVDGTATLMTMFWTLSQTGLHDASQRGVNMLDTGAPLLRRVRVRRRRVRLDRVDRAAVLRRTAAADRARPTIPSSHGRWTERSGPPSRHACAEVFRTKTRDEWCDDHGAHRRVLRPGAAHGRGRRHPHNVARGTFVERGGLTQPAPAPRFSRTSASIEPPARPRRPAHRRRCSPTGALTDRSNRRIRRVRAP